MSRFARGLRLRLWRPHRANDEAFARRLRHLEPWIRGYQPLSDLSRCLAFRCRIRSWFLRCCHMETPFIALTGPHLPVWECHRAGDQPVGAGIGPLWMQDQYSGVAQVTLGRSVGMR
jgi:hypothetical protein